MLILEECQFPWTLSEATPILESTHQVCPEIICSDQRHQMGQPLRPRIPRERRPGVQPTPGEHWGSGFRPLGPKAAPEFGVESLTLASLSRDEGDHHPAALVRRTAPPSPPIFPSGWFPLHVLSQTEEVFGGKCPLFMGGAVSPSVWHPLTGLSPTPYLFLHTGLSFPYCGLNQFLIYLQRIENTFGNGSE